MIRQDSKLAAVEVLVEMFDSEHDAEGFLVVRTSVRWVKAYEMRRRSVVRSDLPCGVTKLCLLHTERHRTTIPTVARGHSG